jgi:hypothetical protein
MSTNLEKILDSYGQTTRQEKRDISFLPLGGLEQSWVKNLEAAVNTRKKIKCVKNSWDGYHVF